MDRKRRERPAGISLRDLGPHYGVEVQFFQNEEFRYRRRFKTRALAVQWAEEERTAIEEGDA